MAEARPTHVVHLAGQASAAISYQRPVETYRINAVGTWTLLEAVRRGSPAARVLVVGTGEVYGPQPEGSRVAENAPFRPVSPYALSKAAADALSDAFARRHGLAVIRTRSSTGNPRTCRNPQMPHISLAVPLVPRRPGTDPHDFTVWFAKPSKRRRSRPPFLEDLVQGGLERDRRPPPGIGRDRLGVAHQPGQVGGAHPRRVELDRDRDP